MKFQIDKNQIRMLEGPNFVTTGNVNSLPCSFVFDSGYKDLDTFAVFYRDDSLNRIVELDSSGSCVIPWELLQSAGYLYVGASGTKTTEIEVLKRATTNAVILRVENSLSSEVTPDAAPEPDIWEAYRTEILNIKTEVQSLKADTQFIKDSTEIFYDVQTNKVGFRRANEIKFTYTGDLTGPQGPIGPQGLQGIQGPQGEPGETIDAYFKAESDSRYAPAITGEAAGTLVTLSDAWVGGVLSKCEISGQTTESGTGDKSPDNPYTLSGITPAKVYVEDAEYPLTELPPLHRLSDGICDTYDAATGTETRRIGVIVLDGTENWTLYDTAVSGKKRIGLHIPNVWSVSNANILPEMICTHYQTTTPEKTWNCLPGITVNISSNPFLAIYDDQYNSADITAWKSWLSAQYQAGTPVTLLYRFAEPVITQRDPIAVTVPAAAANIYADAGEVNITYTKDTGRVIAALLEKLNSIN